MEAAEGVVLIEGRVDLGAIEAIALGGGGKGLGLFDDFAEFAVRAFFGAGLGGDFGGLDDLFAGVVSNDGAIAATFGGEVERGTTTACTGCRF